MKAREFIKAINKVCIEAMNMSKEKYMSINQNNKKITENFKSEFAGYYKGKKVYKRVKL